MDEIVYDRPAVRIVCVDGTGRILLLRWHDTHNGRMYWEPPGGGIDPGESPLEAAQRELTEETGLPGDAVQEGSVQVKRDYMWLGKRYVKTEPFFLARFTGTPDAAPKNFTTEEDETYMGCAWLSPEEITEMDDVDPPNLLEAIAPLLSC